MNYHPPTSRRFSPTPPPGNRGVRPAHAFRTEPQQGQAGTRPRPKPDLSRLPESDRDAVARALDDDPLRRWPSCTDFVAALEAGRSVAAPPAEEPGDAFTAIVKTAAEPSPLPPIGADSLAALNQIIATLIAEAGGDPSAAGDADLPTLTQTDDALRYQLTVGLPLGAARLKLEGFCQQSYGQVVRDNEQGLVFHVNLPTNFWRQWTGRQPGLEVHVQLARHHALSATPIDVTTEIRPFRCTKKRGTELLNDMGTLLLEKLRACLVVNSERRLQDRLLWPHPVRVCPVTAGGRMEEAVECRGKDISLTGIGFYLPHELSTSQVCVQLPSADRKTLALPATLVRAQRCADGWYDVGALFRLSALRKAVPELCRK